MQSLPKLLFGLVAVLLFTIVHPAGDAPVAAVLLPALAAFALGLLIAWLVWGMGPRRA